MQDPEATDGTRRTAASAAAEQRNRRLNIGEASSIGLTDGLAGFVPVLVARLGGSPFEVGLLTSVVGLVGLLFAGPAASIIRRRPDIVRAYSRFRLLGTLKYGAVAVILLVVPGPLAIPAILVVWTLAAFPVTLFLVAVPVVVEGIAGTRGRVDLLAVRWSFMEVGSIVSSAAAGVLLSAMGVPYGYALVMSAAAILAVVTFGFGRRYRVTAAASPAEPASARPWLVARDAFRHRAFRHHIIVRVLLVGGMEAMPVLITLMLVRQLLLEDQAIGLLIAAQRAGAVAGYLVWRRIASRRRTGGILLTAALLAAPYPVALALTPTVLVAAVVLTWAGLAGSGILLGLFDEAMRAIPPERRLPFLGVLISVDYAVILVVPIVAAAVAQAAGVPAALVASGAALGLGALALRVQD